MFTSSRPLILAISLLLLAALLAPVPALAKGRGGGGGGSAGGCFDTYFDSLETTSLTDVEKTKTLFLREEEKLARDVYITLGAKWKLRIFSNIAESEQKHMDAVKRVIDLYDLDDPITDDTVGVFHDSFLVTTYAALIEKGNKSLVDALQVGMTIEDLDIWDLNHLISAATNDHLKFVAYNLLKGSRNHMRSFWKVLLLNFDGPDEDAYKAGDGRDDDEVWLTQDEIDAIVDSPMERGIVYDENGDVIEDCGGGGGGKGKAGQGQRRGQGSARGNGQGKGKRRGMGRGNGQGRGQRDGSNAKGECDGTGPKNKCDGTRGGGRRKGQCDGTCNGAGPAGDAEDSGKKGPRGRNR